MKNGVRHTSELEGEGEALNQLAVVWYYIKLNNQHNYFHLNC